MTSTAPEHAVYFASAVGVLMEVAIPVYGIVALRGMYGGGIGTTLERVGGDRAAR